MNESFDAAFDRLIGHEGGYANNPKDPGGETMWGVTKRVARAWGYNGEMKDLPRETAKKIAYQLYWAPLRLDEFDPEVGFQIFDAHYNGGHVVTWMQQAGGAYCDGILGPRTIAAVKATNKYQFLMRFLALRQIYLVGCKLANGQFAFPTFGRGWINRTSKNLMEGSK